jgi:hypothetical protein
MKSLSPTKIVINQILDNLAFAFPFFFAFYLASLFVSHFYPSWNQYFYWPAFHGSVIVFGILSLASPRAKLLLQDPHTWPQRLFSLFKSLNKRDYFKVIVVSLGVAMASYNTATPIEIMVVAYGIISILWIVESRISGLIALVLLVFCPILLIIKKEIIAENFAVYAYYFFVIMVLTQIREYRQTKGSGTYENQHFLEQKQSG